MRNPRWIAVGLGWSLVALVPSAHALSLSDAMQMAANEHPQSKIANLRVEEAEGNAAEKSAYTYNPTIRIDPQSRRLARGGHTNDYYIAITQGIELGGKQRYRRSAAKDHLDTERAYRFDTRNRLMTNVAKAYVNLVYAEKASHLYRKEETLYQQVVQGLRHQLALGQSSKLDVSLAQGAYAAILNKAVNAEQSYLQQKRAYFSALGREDNSPLKLPPLPNTWHPPSHIFDEAWHSRPDMQALRFKELQADDLAKLAGANRIPDITLFAMSARDAGDHLLRFGVTVPIPIFNDHQGAYRAALAKQESSETDIAWAKKRLRFDVRTALMNEEVTAKAAAEVQSSSIISDSATAVELAREAYEAGELGLEQMVVRIKQAVDAQLTSMETLRQAWMARIALAQVMGKPEIVTEGVTK